MRGRPVLLLLLAAVAAGVAGCQESGFDESKETSKPLKVQHALGESKVPGQAERPLTLTTATFDDTVALGVRPVRAAVPGGAPPAYLRDEQAGVEFIPPVTARALPDLEAADPDLILGSGAAQDRLYADLSKIAPTVMTDGAGGQWKLDLRLAGEALGRTNDAEQLLTDYDAEVARARAAIRHAHPQDREAPVTRVAVARLTENGLRYAPRDSFAGTILADVGVRQVRRLAGADAILLSSDPGGTPHVDGNVTRVDEALWWGDGGALAARAALDDLRAALTG